MTLMDGLEMYICVILTVEFWYDYWWNTRENRIKRRKANASKETKEAKALRDAKILASPHQIPSGAGTGEVSRSTEPQVRHLP